MHMEISKVLKSVVSIIFLQLRRIKINLTIIIIILIKPYILQSNSITLELYFRLNTEVYFLFHYISKINFKNHNLIVDVLFCIMKSKKISQFLKQNNIRQKSKKNLK